MKLTVVVITNLKHAKNPAADTDTNIDASPFLATIADSVSSRLKEDAHNTSQSKSERCRW